MAATRASKSARVPRSGLNGFVAAEFGADGPGAAGVGGVGGCGVVAALAEGFADGVDGRDIEDVETHGSDGGKEGLNVGEGAGASRVRGCGTGEELVPGGVAGSFAIDPEGELFGVAGSEGRSGC